MPYNEINKYRIFHVFFCQKLFLSHGVNFAVIAHELCLRDECDIELQTSREEI